MELSEEEYKRTRELKGLKSTFTKQEVKDIIVKLADVFTKGLDEIENKPIEIQKNLIKEWNEIIEERGL